MSTFKVIIPAGPLMNQADANLKAPKVAAAHQGTWTGVWNTVVPGQMSNIEVEVPVETTGSYSYKTNVLAGPLWSNDEAQKVGSAIAASYGATFTGQWVTIQESVMSVIEIEYKF